MSAGGHRSGRGMLITHGPMLLPLQMSCEQEDDNGQGGDHRIDPAVFWGESGSFQRQ